MGHNRRDLILAGLAAPLIGAWRVAQDRIILSPEETVELEHQDRITRLTRAVRRLEIRPEPRFSTARVPADRMPDNFRVDTPVLRVAFSERTFFETARSEILSSGRDALAAVAEAARGEAADAAVFVAGHTDNVGGEAYNDNLSMQRANAVAEAMYALGVGDVALWRVGFGEAAPLYANDDDEHRAFNRRVEFLFGARVEPVVDVLSRQLDNVCVAATSAASERCRRSLPRRETFEAVQITRRPTGVGLDGRVASRNAAAPQPRTGAAPAPGGRTMAAAAPTRMTIPLIRSHSMAAPRR